ncbi:hypothetical protein [Halobaculum magnesiiphilum]|uniref:Uncharacterized protein n=1 Tax=Halobaculum magnesiiphilum TaxID=1017351 RepID=A0A8T8W9U8_9EURY|nr:hypothetical protein [Halobaculum magnesiiphilum]QZP36607.1 hypothetical protein K6T50_09795 [Halobaculum magnesiiphilum]
MGDERTDRGSDGVSEDERDGERPRSMVVTELRRENQRLRERVAEQRRERKRIVDRYEVLLDAARGDDGDEADDTRRSILTRLLDRLRRRT